jgi:hypothetical protein
MTSIRAYAAFGALGLGVRQWAMLRSLEGLDWPRE